MLITDKKYFRPIILTKLFQANDIVTDAEEVVNVNLLSSSEIAGGMEYVYSVQYKDFRTQRHAPDQLILKLITEAGANAQHELIFYQRLVGVMKRKISTDLLRFPVCYDGYFDEEMQQAHLIIDDFSQEHKPSAENIPPTDKHRKHIIDTLAHLHGFWWEHPLIEEITPLPNEEQLQASLLVYQSKFSEIQSSFGQYLESKYLNILEKIAEKHPQQRVDDVRHQRNYTIIHGALHPQNLVYSIMKSYIINWQNWRVGHATDDLATMIPMYWSDELRNFQEMPLLKRYHGTISQYGVVYSWDTFMYDYRVSLAQMIGGMLANWTRSGHMRGDWAKIETAIDSFIAMEGEQIFK